MHPIAQQYIIIKGYAPTFYCHFFRFQSAFFSYLKQAAEAGRQEEIVTLERNLKDLEAELKKLQIETPRA